jgi:hypothetical protein
MYAHRGAGRQTARQDGWLIVIRDSDTSLTGACGRGGRQVHWVVQASGRAAAGKTGRLSVIVRQCVGRRSTDVNCD